MRRRAVRLLPCTLTLLFFLPVQAQIEKRVTGNFEGYTFARLAARLEVETDYHFYYDPADVDSMSIDMTLNKATIRQILDELFQNTDLHYSIDSALAALCYRAHRAIKS
jgi:hypothetical protein